MRFCGPRQIGKAETSEVLPQSGAEIPTRVLLSNQRAYLVLGKKPDVVDVQVHPLFAVVHLPERHERRLFARHGDTVQQGHVCHGDVCVQSEKCYCRSHRETLRSTFPPIQSSRHLNCCTIAKGETRTSLARTSSLNLSLTESQFSFCQTAFHSKSQNFLSAECFFIHRVSKAGTSPQKWVRTSWTGETRKA